MILSCTPSCSCKSNKKRKEKKRNIDNDLAVLPSYDRESQHHVQFLLLAHGGGMGISEWFQPPARVF